MMSKNSFLAKGKMNRKNFLFDFSVVFVCLFFMFPFSLLTRLHGIVQDVQRGYMEETANSLQEFLRQYVHLDFAGNSGKILIVAFIGAFLAFRSFYYLYSRKKMDFYESQPITRKNRFLRGYANGVFCFFLAYLLNFVIAILVSAGNGAMTGTAFGIGLHGFLVLLLSFLGAYHLTILVISITGNIISGILGLLVLEFYEIGVRMCTVFFRDRYTETMSSYFGNDNLTSISNVQWKLMEGCEDSDLNRALTGNTEGVVGKLFSDTALGMLYAAALCVIFLALAYVAFKKRPSEAAGKTIAYSFLKPVLKICLVTLGGILSCLLFQAAFSDTMGFAVFGLIFGVLLTGGITQMVFEQDIRAFFRKPVQLAAGGVISAIIFAVFVFDLTGYDEYSPDPEKVESCAIMIWDLAGANEYLDENDRSEPAVHHVLSNMELDTVEEINEFMQKHIESNYREGVYPADNSGKRQISAELCWRLKNGRTEHRRVEVYQEDVEDALSVILSQEEYKRTMFQIYDDDMFERAGKVEFSYHNGFSYKELPTIDFEEFKEAYEKDMENYGYGLATQVPVGYVNVKLSEKLQNSNAFSEYFQFNCYVYDSFENTKRCLEKMGVTSLAPDLDNTTVIKAKVNVYEENGEDGTWQNRTIVIEDEDKIKELLSASTSGELQIPYMDTAVGGECLWEENLDVEFQCGFTRGETTASGYACDTDSVCAYIFKERMPQWLVEEIQNQKE